MRRAMAFAVLAVSALSGCSLDEQAGLSWDVEQVEQDLRQDYEAKLTDVYPNARVRSVHCVEETESRLQCTARLTGADRDQVQLDVTGSPDNYVWEEA